MSSAQHSSAAGTSPDEVEQLSDGYTGAGSGEAPAPVLRRQESRASQRSIPIGSLDPEGTAELTRRLTAQSLRSANADNPKDLEEGEPHLTNNPFDTDGKFDLEKFLRDLFQRGSDRGNETRTMGVAFQDLKVTGFGSGVGLSSSVGSTLLEPVTALANIQALRHPPVKTILEGFEGCIKPGEMVLVLGRPGSGCTTLLKTLASYRDGFRSIEGELSWQGWGHQDINGSLRGEVVYAPEDDVHFPTLTVGETLDFCVATRAPQEQRRVTLDDNNSRDAYRSLAREALGTILGLRHTFNTKVGNELIRGISGGEKKRVSIAELLSTRAKVALYDNSTRGLDSSTAVEFVRSLRIATDIAKLSTVTSIYQAGESLTQMFDKVVVLAAGRMIYYGPLENAAQYFDELGFERHWGQTTADYLVSVTDEHARIIRAGFEDRAPRTPEEFAAAFRNSEAGRRNHEETTEYMQKLRAEHTLEAQQHYKEVQRQEKAKHTRAGSAFLLSWPQQIRLAMRRRAQIMRGDMITQYIVTGASIFQSLIIGSTFYMMPKNTSGFFSRGGVLFFAMLFNAFTAMTEVAAGYGQRPIVIRQARFAMLHSSADALANTLLDIPLRILTSLPFSIVLYFMTGLYYSADAFFIYLGVVLLVTFIMVAVFRFLAAVFRSESNATMVAGLIVIDLALYAGYVIPRKSMVVWWKWLSYCNPVAFGFEILITNEFRKLNVPCAQLVPSGPGFANVPSANQVCSVAGAEPGATIIDGAAYASANYGYEFSNSSRNAGILIGFWIFFAAAYAIVSEFQTDPTASGGRMIFKRNRAPKAVAAAAKAGGSDLEKGEQENIGEHTTPEEDAAAQEALDKLAVSSDVFSWSHVNYDVLIKGSPRRLLDDVSGYVAPGKLTALMGESGAGKTTLLNVLAQRAGTGIVDGSFLVAGRPLPRSFQADTGYCQQQDTHMSTATVREALQFSALLRQPAEVPKAEKLAYVETVLRMLEMESFAEAMVGDPGNGLNVEQRKRLTIAVELAARPKLLLFLDEPTSGLDAQAAWSIVRFLRKLADAGQAILCTIHQPSGELFNQFDRLILLKKGGQVVYAGDLGKNCSTLLPYFEKHSGKKCAETDNPAEYCLDVIGAGATATTKFDWHRLYLESEMHRQLVADLEIYAHASDGKQVSAEDAERGNREYATGLSTQFRLVLGRNFAHYWRSPTYIFAKVLLNLFAGLFIGSSFYGQGIKVTTASLQNKLFSIFMALVLSTSLAQQAQPVFISFRGLYEARERPSKLYAWPVAIISAILVEIPWNFIGTTAFFIPWYFFIFHDGLGALRGFYMWLALMFFSVYWHTFATACAGIAPNAQLASVLFSVFFSFVIVFCGVVQPPPLMPAFWRVWMVNLSPFTYLLEGLLGNVLGGEPVICAASELNRLIPPTGQSCAQFLGPYYANGAPGYFVQNADGSCGTCAYSQGETFLSSLSTAQLTFSSSHKWRNLGLIAAYICFNLALCLGAFWAFRIHQWGKKGAAPAKTRASEAQPPSDKAPDAAAGQTVAAELDPRNEKPTAPAKMAAVQEKGESALPTAAASPARSASPTPAAEPRT